MRFNQMFLRMTYNGEVKVYRIVRCDTNGNEVTMDTEYIGTFSRYDSVPRDIWTSRVHMIEAEKRDVFVAIIEKAA